MITAAVPLFRNTNRAAMTSRKNTLLRNKKLDSSPVLMIKVQMPQRANSKIPKNTQLREITNLCYITCTYISLYHSYSINILYEPTTLYMILYNLTFITVNQASVKKKKTKFEQHKKP